MKVYVVTQYIDQEVSEVVRVFDNKEAAESYMNCFTNEYDLDCTYLHEMELENTNTYSPKYIIRNEIHDFVPSIHCIIPCTEYEVDDIITYPHLAVYYNNQTWNPRPDIVISIELAVDNKEVGDNFAKLCNETLATAQNMLETYSFAKVKEFIISTLEPIMEEIRIKEE